MASKPDKFGIKFWMVVYNESNRLYSGFSYMGKNETRDTSMSVPTSVVMKLMKPLFKHGYNATCDNFFTSLDVATHLAKEKCSLVGTIRQNRRELPQAAKVKQQLHETTLFKNYNIVNKRNFDMLPMQKPKSVMILSTRHPEVAVSSENNPKKKPETVLFYNKTKAGIDVVDQMTRKYSVKAKSRRWPVHVFCNVIDLAIINSWILNKETCKLKINRRVYMQRIAEELCGSLLNNETDEINESEQEAPRKKRRTWLTTKCRNRMMMMICCTYKQAIRGKCSTNVCLKCVK